MLTNFVKKRIYSNLPTVLVWLLSCGGLAGCGGKQVMVKLKQDFQSASLKRGGISVVQVLDTRAVQPNWVGRVAVGLLNKEVPYYVTEGVSVLVRKMIDSLIVLPQQSDSILPIIVLIDTFQVNESTRLSGEYGHFKCYLRFIYPVRTDSFAYVTIRTLEQTRSFIDVTSKLKKLIYPGVAHCIQNFILNVYDREPHLYTISRNAPETIAKMSSYANALYEKAVTENRRAQNAADSLSKNDRCFETNPSAKSAAGVETIGLHFFTGPYIKTGKQGFYQVLRQPPNSAFSYGVRYSWVNYAVDNKQNGLKDFFSNVGIGYTMRYYRDAVYFGVAATLAVDVEEIKNSDKPQRHLFLGPTIEGVAGISLGRRLALEAGVLHLRHTGSKLLPASTGLIFGINIGI